VIAALRYEWVRVSTVRSTRICLVLTALLAGLGGYAVAHPHQDLNQFGDTVGPVLVDWYGAFSSTLAVSVVIVSVVAAQAIGQEYRFGIIRLTLTAFPNRMQVMAAKLVAVVAIGVVFTIVSYAASWIGVTVRGYPTPPASTLVPDSTFLLRGAVFMVLWALSAFALAGMTRQTAIGIAVPVVSGVIVEQLLGVLLSGRSTWLAHALPWSNAGRWSDVVPTLPAGSERQVDLTGYPPVAWAAVGIFAVWVALFLVVETVTFLRRDA
jgi:ABC-type transport system involved in multi-copper enzyme maturation permease subunit